MNKPRTVSEKDARTAGEKDTSRMDRIAKLLRESTSYDEVITQIAVIVSRSGRDLFPEEDQS